MKDKKTVKNHNCISMLKYRQYKKIKIWHPNQIVGLQLSGATLADMWKALGSILSTTKKRKGNRKDKFSKHT